MISYCLNALCQKRDNNIQNTTKCSSCGASLLIEDRFQLVKKLRPDNVRGPISVYEGLDLICNKSIIAKVIEIYSPNIPNLLKREKEILAYFPSKLYPSAAQYYEIKPSPETDGLTAAVLILPKIIGIDSNEWIQQHSPISQTQAIEWFHKLLPYLKRLSEIAVLHRDIKPSNIIVGENDDLTLIDYGTARLINNEYLAIISDDVVNSKTNDYQIITRVYSAGYTAPEQNQGKSIPQSDYFSLGRTIIYWITGRSPSDMLDLDTNQIDWSRISSPHKFNSCFLEFLERLTHPNPKKRPLTLDDIEVFLDTRLPELIQEEQQRHSKKAKAIKAITINAGRLGLALLGLTGLWYGFSQTLYSQGLEALERTQYEKSRSKFETALKVNPFHNDALYYLGLECQGRGDKECAENYYKRSLKWSWNPAGTQYQLGVLNENQGDYDNARHYYHKSIKSKTNPEAYNRLARLEIQKGKLDQAQQFIQAGLKIADDDDMKARLLTQQGHIHYEKQEWVKAEKVLQESGELVNTAESVCLLPKISENLNRPQYEIDGRWYTCFYSPNEYPEGADLKQELLKKALPSIFSDE